MILLKKCKEGFLKFLENKTIIQSFIWDTYVKRLILYNPYEAVKFEKQIGNYALLLMIIH